MMNNTTKRIEGAAEQAGGAIKKGVGSLIGNPQMEAEGRVAEISGEAKQASAKAAERVKGAVEEVTGAIEHGAGKLVDDKHMAAAGKAKQVKGEVRQKLNH
jgi:uncharacterized protein YjbJ (UPF0337 family)